MRNTHSVVTRSMVGVREGSSSKSFRAAPWGSASAMEYEPPAREPEPKRMVPLFAVLSMATSWPSAVEKVADVDVTLKAPVGFSTNSAQAPYEATAERST